jgi:uncharacterized protein YecE (DUF72 family)
MECEKTRLDKVNAMDVGGRKMAIILIGTSGWSYPDWKGVVYPPDAGSRFDELVYLAHLCDTVEINSSFYRIPNRRSIDSWLERTADLTEFQFSAKLFKGLTHERDKNTRDELLGETLNTFRPIHDAGRLAAILLQFPWSFKFCDDSMAWLDWLVEKLGPMPLAVEVRHTSWLNDEYFEYLKERRLAFCNIDQPAMHGNIGPTEKSTASFAYVRFHGRNGRDWFTENEDASQRYNHLYSTQELDEWADRIHRMARDAERIYIYMNNHVGGQGLTNALQLKAKLSGGKVAAPRGLVLKFPQLSEMTIPFEEPVNAKMKSGRKSKDKPPENLLF